MDKYDFIKKLEKELSGLSQEEINEAVSYYKELFEEAGSEHEQELISNLGSPASIAENIKRESGMVAVIEEEVSEKSSEKSADSSSASDKAQPRYEEYNSSAQNNTNTAQGSGKREVRRDGTTILLLSAIAFLTAPVWLPLLIAFYAVFISLVFTVLVIALVFGVIGISGIVSGIALLIPILPLGCILLGLGLLFTAATLTVTPYLVKGLFFVCRAVLNGTIAVFHSIFYKKEAAAV